MECETCKVREREASTEIEALRGRIEVLEAIEDDFEDGGDGEEIATPDKDIALAIKIGERFFRGFGKRGQTLTAWSLAGAKLFLSPVGEFWKMKAQLSKKKTAFEIVKVSAR